MQARNLWLFVGVLWLVTGCSSQGTSTQASESSAPAATEAQASGSKHGDAIASIVPGSYEDWCEEHGVPETQCTRCDPSLVPAFQAAHDWCADHGLPMSQCTIHAPNLKIVRPPKPEGK